MNILGVLGMRHLIRMASAHKAALKYIRGFMVTECIMALFNIGIIDDLLRSGRLNIESYAKSKNLDEKTLKIIFDYLYSLKLLDRNKDGHHLTKSGKFLSQYARGPFDFAGAYSLIFNNLESLLRKQKRYGLEIKKDEFLVAKASTETEKWLPYPIIKEILKKYKYKNVLDLGCGSAYFLIELCKENSLLKGFGIDISTDAIGLAREELELSGLRNRIEIKQCDIFNIKNLPESWLKQVDVITSMFVLHEFIKDGSTGKVLDILREIKKYFGNSSLIVCELCRKTPEQLRRTPNLITEHHLFHALSNQEILTYKEWVEIFKQVPFKSIKLIKIDFAGQGYFILK